MEGSAAEQHGVAQSATPAVATVASMGDARDSGSLEALASRRPLDVMDHLGPEAEPWAGSLADAYRYVDIFTRASRENFSVLSRLVPVELRPAFGAVYAFCRWADDLGDETGIGDKARARSECLLAWWRGQLRAAVAGQPAHPVMAALADTIQRHALSVEHFHALIDAFELDQRVNRYDTWEELLGYCELSANPVGRIVLELAGLRMSRTAVDSDASLAETRRLSDLVCTALQLTNFWQDVRRDLLDRDRVYLPSAESGLTADDLRLGIERPDDSEFRVRYITAVRALVDRTRDMYEDAAALPGIVPEPVSRMVWLFVAGGRATLERIEQHGCTTLWARPRLGRTAKALLVVRAMIGPVPSVVPRRSVRVQVAEASP